MSLTGFIAAIVKQVKNRHPTYVAIDGVFQKLEQKSNHMDLTLAPAKMF